jgi:sterol 3beta-glucosyltransferase
MQIPLHVMSLMPVTPTTEFHHPMAAVKSINMDGSISGLPGDVLSGAANYFSYKAFDLHLWQGVSEHISAFRKHLQLPPYPQDTNDPAHALQNLRIPVSYLWSPSLLPKPKDWGSHVQVRPSHTAPVTQQTPVAMIGT